MANILIMDDDAVARTMLGAALNETGHQTAFATNGEEGCVLFWKTPFDCVVLDLAMPVMNGLVALQQIMAEFPKTRIIAISGVDPEQLELARKFGALKTMMKPVTPKEIQDAVEEVLGPGGSPGWDTAAK
jgi:CheY-like chemotaxis protein